MAEPIHLELLADFFNRIGQECRFALRKTANLFVDHSGCWG
jgi:hypothetical protein